ncbi:hypothetical protein FJZ31_34520 [Candidatus Poribacteria bacterium]|nr:hypothetical protein [Candidatus Poribacteria bacterium]
MKTIFCSLLLIFILSVSAVDATDDWTRKYPDPKPSARYYHAMAYIGGDKVLLFGGWDDETWIYDFSDNTWTQKFPSSHPSARVYHAMAYIGEGKVLLFGGQYSVYYDETWVYNLNDNTWTQKFPSPHPSALSYHAMAYIGGDKVLLFGGWYNDSLYDETWVYDLSEDKWTQQNPSSKPLPRYGHAIAYIGGDKVLLFGGLHSGDWTRYDDTWVYHLSGNTWTQDMNTSQPSGRYGHKLSETSMDGSSYLVLFGGYDGALDDETWTFGGGDYSLPVELSSFTATTGDGTVILRWRAETEVNNIGFAIYRSEEKDGNYTRINFVPGAGSSAMPNDYQFTDKKVEQGKTYFYYLEDVDVAGEKNRTKIIKVVVPPAQPIPKEFRLL